MKEHILQQRIVAWIEATWPDVVIAVNPYSGMRMTSRQAIAAKRQGLRPGLPDLAIYEPRGGYHGLFIELKIDGSRIVKKDGSPVSEHVARQLDIAAKLNERGYLSLICIGETNAKEAIVEYMEKKL